MTEHTPGPWIFDGLCQIVEAERPHMRVCFLPSDHHEYASSKPNGHLIAAAPDMLEAVQLLEKAEDARQSCDECEGEGEPEACGKCFPMFDDARVKRRLAIAKATGANG